MVEQLEQSEGGEPRSRYLLVDCQFYKGKVCLRSIIEESVTVCRDIPGADVRHPCRLDGSWVKGSQVET